MGKNNLYFPSNIKMIDDTYLKLSIHKAFLGHIGTNIRAIAYDYTNICIFIYAYLNQGPRDDDFEIIDRAATEILADFPQLESQDITLIKTANPIASLDAHKGWIFVRYEN